MLRIRRKLERIIHKKDDNEGRAQELLKAWQSFKCRSLFVVFSFIDGSWDNETCIDRNPLPVDKMRLQGVKIYLNFGKGKGQGRSSLVVLAFAYHQVVFAIYKLGISNKGLYGGWLVGEKRKIE